MSNYDYLFNDYIQYYSEIMDNDWIVLFEEKEGSSLENDIFTFCALSDLSLLKSDYMENYEWGFSATSFGKSTYGMTYSGLKEEVYFSDGTTDDEFEYLIALRYFEKYDRIIDINPKLIWYNDLVKYNGNYVHPKTDEVIIRVSDHRIDIRKEYLRDFLCAYKKICVIVFDHRRFFNGTDDIDYSFKDYNDKGYFLSRNVSSARDFNDEYNSFSSIIGKAVILPFQKPRHEDYKYFAREKEFENFIIGYDEENDEVVEFTCNENMLANYFGANPEAPHFLTPTYFKISVLDKYKSDARNYNITDSMISYLTEWSIPFSINDEKSVVVWLGDLGRIPYEEQKYWRTFNMKQKGNIEKKFYERQILNKWTDSSRVESKLVPTLNRINAVVNEKYGDVLFSVLSEADSEIYNTFMIPTNLSIPEYQSFLMKLSKLVAESINVKLVKRVLGDNCPSQLGSVLLLGEFLKYTNIDIHGAICSSIKKAYDSRNKLAGHKGSYSSYNKVWERDDNYQFSSINDATVLLENIVGSIEYALKELSEVE